MAVKILYSWIYKVLRKNAYYKFKELSAAQLQSNTSRFPPDCTIYQWGLVASTKPLKPPFIFGFSGALLFMLMDPLTDLKMGFR